MRGETSEDTGSRRQGQTPDSGQFHHQTCRRHKEANLGHWQLGTTASQCAWRGLEPVRNLNDTALHSRHDVRTMWHRCVLAATSNVGAGAS